MVPEMLLVAGTCACAASAAVSEADRVIGDIAGRFGNNRPKPRSGGAWLGLAGCTAMSVGITGLVMDARGLTVRDLLTPDVVATTTAIAAGALLVALRRFIPAPLKQGATRVGDVAFGWAPRGTWVILCAGWAGASFVSGHVFLGVVASLVTGLHWFLWWAASTVRLTPEPPGGLVKSAELFDQGRTEIADVRAGESEAQNPFTGLATNRTALTIKWYEDTLAKFRHLAATQGRTA